MVLASHVLAITLPPQGTSADEQLLLLTQSGQEHDTRLMCLALRALYDVGRVACLGVVDTSPTTNESMHQILHEVRAHHRRFPLLRGLSN